MRPQVVRPLSFLCFLLVVFGQSTPTIGIIEIYGARKTSQAEIRKALGLTEGGRLTGSKGTIEDRIGDIDDVVAARVEAACCEGGKIILYVGVQEKGAPSFEYRTPPAEEIAFPEDVHSTYAKFIEAVRAAGKSGDASEDLSRGHSLMSDPAVRKIQSQFPVLANEHLEILRSVIRRSIDPEHRAIAAYVIGYADNKSAIVNDVQYALQDIDDTVRSNAIRAIAALAVLASKTPDPALKVSPTWLIEMLKSVTWTDRNNAAVALVTITETRDPGALDQLRERALTSLVEMARWEHLAHALPAYILLGRVAGIPEKELQDAWSHDQRELIIKRAASSNKK
jgi:hypothetical protein